MYLFIIYQLAMQNNLRKEKIAKLKDGPYFSKIVSTKDNVRMAIEYHLSSILTFNIKAIDIYLYYFPSYFKKGSYHEESVNNKTSLSQFFNIFVRIFLLKQLINLQDTITNSVQAMLKDFIDEKRIIKSSFDLLKQLKIRFTTFLDTQYKQLMKVTEKECTVDSTRKIFYQINSLLKQLQQKFDNQIQCKKLLQTQYLPQSLLTSQQKKKYIMNCFKSIINSKFLSSRIKKQGILDFLKRNVNFYNFKLQTKQTMFKTKYYSNKIQIQKKQQQIGEENESVNSRHQNFISDMEFFNNNVHIVFLKQQPEIKSINTKIQNYLISTSMNNVKFLHHSSRPELMQNIIKDIIQQSTNYYSKTKSFYPSISLRDIYFNQKKLRGCISEERLILDAVGFSEDIFNYQMKLVYGMTPNIESQKCYLEYYTTAQILLNRICYLPNKETKDQNNQYEITKNKVKIPQINKKIIEDYEQNQENSIAKRYEYNARELNENVYVWRLINIFYYILKLQKLNMRLYNTYDEEGDLQVNLSKPFFMNKYRRVLKKSYQMMEKGDISVPQLLSYEQQGQEEENEWKFNMKSLRNIYDFKQIDSMMEPLQFVRIKAQFYMRFIIIKQFTSLLSHECFKRLINPIKYILTLLINTMEYFYQVKRVIQQSQKRKHSRSQIIASFDNLYKDIKLDYQSFKQTALKTQVKVQQYKKKNSNQLSYMFINKNKTIYQGAMKLISNIKMVQKLHDELQSIEINILNNTNIKDKKQIWQFQMKQEQYMKKTQVLFNICTEKYKDSVQLILTFLQKEIQSISIEQFCKNDKNISKDYFAIMLKKIILSVKVLLILNESNWKQFQVFYAHLLIDDRNVKNKNIKVKVQVLDKHQLQRLEQNLNFTQKILEKFKLNESQGDKIKYIQKNRDLEQSKKYKAEKLNNVLQKLKNKAQIDH